MAGGESLMRMKGEKQPMSKSDVPWSYCRVSFNVITNLNAYQFQKRWELIEGKPPNWELTDVFFRPSLSVVTYNVKGEPTKEDGKIIAKLISKIEE